MGIQAYVWLNYFKFLCACCLFNNLKILNMSSTFVCYKFSFSSISHLEVAEELYFLSHCSHLVYAVNADLQKRIPFWQLLIKLTPGE